MSLDAVQEVITAEDQDLAAIQLAHYWLKTDWWVCQHNAEVEEAERAQKEEEDLKKFGREEESRDWRRLEA